MEWNRVDCIIGPHNRRVVGCKNSYTIDNPAAHERHVCRNSARSISSYGPLFLPGPDPGNPPRCETPYLDFCKGDRSRRFSASTWVPVGVSERPCNRLGLHIKGSDDTQHNRQEQTC